ncbi:MAG TPA: hypothetical protein PLY93_15850 [Turneriella sp.]|nr:hypothetical protein [Turneriella sp.]
MQCTLSKSLLSLIFLTTLYAETKATNAPQNEMDAYRAILTRPTATRQDLYDLVAMQDGVFEKYPQAAERNRYLSQKGITIKEETNTEVSRGEVAKVTLQHFNLEKGILFWLTGWEFYALRDIQQLDIMQQKFTVHQALSGKQLIGIWSTAVATAERRDNYSQNSGAQNEETQ